MVGRSRALTFRVKIGAREFSRKLTWKEISRLKELFKEFSRWDPESKRWVVRIERLVKYPNIALAAFSEAFGSEGEAAVKNVLEEESLARSSEARKGRLLLLSTGYVDDRRAYKLVRTCAKKVVKTLAGEQVEYYLLDVKSAVQTMLKWGIDPDEVERELLSILSTLDQSLSEEQVRAVKHVIEDMTPRGDHATVVDAGYDGALVLLPRRLSFWEFTVLSKELSIEYYQQKVIEGSVELVPSLLNAIRKISDKVLLIPYFALPRLKSILAKWGIGVEDKVEWPLRRLNVPEVKVTLYSFQEEALRAWKNSGRRGTIVMPTGAGKTYVALAAIAELKLSTLICVTTVELARQWARRISEALNIKPGIVAGGEKRVADVTVATYHSAARSMRELYDKFAFIVYDEGHHLPAETFKEIAFRAKALYSMVLSATPERADKNEGMIYRVAGPPVYTVSYFDLVMRGILAPFKLEKVEVSLSEEEAEKYAEVAEDLSLGSLQRTSELIKLASKAAAKIEALKSIVKEEKGKMIVFCQYLDQASEAYEAVKEVEPRCALITGSTPKGRRLAMLEAFKRGAVRVIVTTTVLDEGVDVPDADVAVVLSGSGQVRQMVQRLGRILRWTPGKVARMYEVVASGTIEEALSRSRSVFKLFDQREVRAAMEIATRAYDKIKDLIEKYREAPLHEKEKIIGEIRAEYIKAAAEAARSAALV